jgi:hypothetical protein
VISSLTSLSVLSTGTLLSSTSFSSYAAMNRDYDNEEMGQAK